MCKQDIDFQVPTSFVFSVCNQVIKEFEGGMVQICAIDRIYLIDRICAVKFPVAAFFVSRIKKVTIPCIVVVLESCRSVGSDCPAQVGGSL